MTMLDEAAADLQRTVAALRRELDERTAERNEAQAQQTATGEILSAISRSPADIQPVSEAIVARAATLCEAGFSAVAKLDDGLLHLVAVHSLSPEETAAFYSLFPRSPERNFAMGRAFVDAQPVNFEDVLSEAGYDIRTLETLQSMAKYRSFLGVPIFREGRPIGVIGCGRREVRPFTPAQIELVKIFADQAAIAIENVRLFGELEARNREVSQALERQTATAEVLQVINSSPGDLAPVFNAILEKAHSLCDIAQGSLELYDGDWFRAVAVRGLSDEFAEILRQGCPAADNPATQPLIEGRRFAHILDLAETDYKVTRSAAELDAARTLLCVPLRRDGVLLGMIASARREVRPFSDKEIALLENFAAQAVIAMENARLINETREALEQQTATAEVLGVINSSPGDLTPVFEAILDKAHTLCGATPGSLFLFDGELFRAAATQGYPEDLAERLRQGVILSATTQLLDDGVRWVHNPDLTLIDAPTARAVSGRGGVRTNLMLPLRKDGRLLGAISCNRQEVRPFTDKEIALLQNFAAQAVIAMENARLLTETRESLEQQTATSEVLQVINSSPGDLAPVFDAMLDKALRLCEAAFGLLIIWDGEQFHRVAFRGVPNGLIEAMRQPLKPTPGGFADRLVRGERVIAVADLLEASEQPIGPGAQLLVRFGARSYVGIALRRDDALLGAIVIYRREVRPFSDKQVALLQNFAARAVIAMENARLITETREALEQQTATAEVLQVINSSPGDLAPVFDAMLDKALRLCGAAFGALRMWDGKHLTRVAWRATPGFDDVSPKAVTAAPGSLAERFVRGETVISISDLVGDANYQQSAGAQSLVRRGSARTFLGVALRKDDRLLGTLVIYRQEVRPFTEKQIALLQSFADQAVIAIENARLLNELRDRTRDLQESLEYQTATSDVLKVISRSTFDLQPVLDTLVETAARLCAADLGNLSTRQGDGYRVAATFSTSPEFIATIQGRLLPVGRGSVAGRAASSGQVVRIADLAADPDFAVTETVAVAKMRTAIGVPLLREGVVVGVFSLARGLVEPFTERQIELVRTFADQAVIAIENTRLITETREALEQQTATAEVLLNRSPGDLQPVYDVILEKAHDLCGVGRGSLQLYDGEYLRVVAAHASDVPSAFVDRVRRGYRASDYPVSRPLLDGARFVHIADLVEIDHPLARAFVELAGTRSLLFVPLRREGALLGVIAAARQEVRPFSEKQIALLESFAAQAVIAMDNARLLNEIRRRQAELRVTFDNMGDGVAMFDGELRLAAGNRNFQEMLALPDALLAERPTYADYVRALAERGEFGSGDIEAELSRRLAETDQELRLERTGPTGAS